MTSSPGDGGRNNVDPASAANSVEYHYNPSESSSNGFCLVKGAFSTTHPVDLVPNQSSSTETRSQNGDLYGEAPEGIPVFSLRPADEGFGAWSYAMSAFAMFVVVWGFPQSFPIFQTYLSAGEVARHPDSVVLPLLAPGLQDILEGLMFPLLPKAPRHRRLLVIVGILTITVAVFLASCARTAWLVVLTQGILFGVGGILMNFVHVSIFSEWFEKKKDKAMGIIWLGWRVGSLGFPVVCLWLLDKHGYEKTLRVLIAPMLALLIPAIMLFRGRFAESTVTFETTKPRVSKVAVLRSPNVLFYLFVSLLFYLIENVPVMFILAFGMDLKLSSSDQALALSLRVLCTMAGSYVVGRLVDSGYRDGVLAASGVTTSLFTCLIWGYTKTKFGLFSYAAAIGLASGGYTNCIIAVLNTVAGFDGELFTTFHGIFSLFRGIAILSIGPIGILLLKISPEVRLDEFAIGKYKYLILYASVLSMTSGVLTISRMIWQRRQRGEAKHFGEGSNPK